MKVEFYEYGKAVLSYTGDAWPQAGDEVEIKVTKRYRERYRVTAVRYLYEATAPKLVMPSGVIVHIGLTTTFGR